MSKKNQDADVAFISALADLLNEKDLAEIEVKRDYSDDTSLNVRVSRSGSAAVMTLPAPSALPQIAAPTVAPQATAAAPAAETGAASGDPENHPGAVPSPMVGTVYLQPEPGAPAFIEPGTSVSEGQTLLIIEAMKTMNQIPSPRAGTVKRILIEDGAPVEYGAPLMVVE